MALPAQWTVPSATRLYFCLYLFVYQQDKSKSCRQISYEHFLGVGCLVGNEPFDFGADRDHDPNQLLTEFLSKRESGQL